MNQISMMEHQEKLSYGHSFNTEKNGDASTLPKAMSVVFAKYPPATGSIKANNNHLELKVISHSESIKAQDLKIPENPSKSLQYSVITLTNQPIPCQSSGSLSHTKAKLPTIKTIAYKDKPSILQPPKSENSAMKGLSNRYQSMESRQLAINNIHKENFVSIEDDSDGQLIGPSSRWLSQPRSYRGAKRDLAAQKKLVRKVWSFGDTTTDGETSGVGSSLDEPLESSTESASETPGVPSPSFLQPRLASRPLAASPSALKKRRGGWPKGRKRKPELPGMTKPPKAPLTGYVLFLNERRKFYKETRPCLPFGEVTKLLGAEWSAMGGEEKAVYLSRSEQDRRRYRNELRSFRQTNDDQQLLLRRKRIKNVIISRGATTTEESSDFTDEIDDDESEELHCRTCDQWFSSLHNKREHLYGRHHLLAITTEYQREREAEEKRQAGSSPLEGDVDPLISRVSDPTSRGVCEKEENAERRIVENPGDSRVAPSSQESLGVSSTTEEDPEDDEDDDDTRTQEEEDGEEAEDDEEREYDGEEEEEEEEEEAGGGGDRRRVSRSPVDGGGRVSEAAESVICRMLGREKEIRFLRRRQDKVRLAHRKLSSSLMALESRRQKLEAERALLSAEEETLLKKARHLERLVALLKVPSSDEPVELPAPNADGPFEMNSPGASDSPQGSIQSKMGKGTSGELAGSPLPNGDLSATEAAEEGLLVGGVAGEGQNQEGKKGIWVRHRLEEEHSYTRPLKSSTTRRPPPKLHTRRAPIGRVTEKTQWEDAWFSSEAVASSPCSPTSGDPESREATADRPPVIISRIISAGSDCHGTVWDAIDDKGTVHSFPDIADTGEIVSSGSESRESNGPSVLEDCFTVWSRLTDSVGSVDSGSTTNELTLTDLIQEDIYFRQLASPPLETPGGFSHLAPLSSELFIDLHWTGDDSLMGGRPDYSPQFSSPLEDILEDDALINLLEDDT